MAKPKLKPLPPVDSPKYHAVLLDNVVAAYEVFLSDTMALDYCGVTGKRRSLILDDKDYSRRTKARRAERFLEEIDEIERLSADLKGADINERNYDIRDPKAKAMFDKDYKDLFGMRLKAAEMRRELLNMGKREDEQEEAESLNIFYVPVTREEFERLKTTELNEGDDTGGSEALAEEAIKEGPVKSILSSSAYVEDEEDEEAEYAISKEPEVSSASLPEPAKPKRGRRSRLVSLSNQPKEDQGSFKVNADGSVEDF